MEYLKPDDSGKGYTDMCLQYIFLDNGWDDIWEKLDKSNGWTNDPIILRELCEDKNFEETLSDEKKKLWKQVKEILEELWKS
jgi:hypothetical protein